MPSQILHTLFGEDVISGLHSRLEENGYFGPVAGKDTEKNSCSYRDAFVLGCQGPDIFYHNLRTRPVALEYGTLLHRRNYGDFAANLLKTVLPDFAPGEKEIPGCLNEKEIGATGVYALGFMTHAALDRFCHPYILYKSVDLREQKNAGENGMMHPFFERIIDVQMLGILRHRELSSWDQETFAKICENPPAGLKELIIRALILTFPERAGRDVNLNRRIDNTFADCARFFRLTDPAKTALVAQGSSDYEPVLSRRIVSLIFPEDLPEDVDCLNLKREPWYYPYRKPAENGTPIDEPVPDSRSFPEIYTDAVKNTIDSLSPCFTEYLKTGVFPTDAAARSIGNGSLSIRDEEGKPCAPNFTSPLPLEKVLQGQLEMRNRS